MKSKKMTRRERNNHINRYELYRPFVFYAVLLAGLNAAAISGGAFSIGAAAAHFAAGLLSWGLIEYVIHRWVLHRVPGEAGLNLPGNVTHLTHHEDPSSLERLNVQLRESLPVCAAYCLLAWAATGDWRAVAHLYTGLMAGYFFYEYLDFQAHHGTARGRLVRYFRKNHLLHHHYDAEVRFGVTSPLFDLLFGTFRLERKTDAGRGPARAASGAAGAGIYRGAAEGGA